MPILKKHHNPKNSKNDNQEDLSSTGKPQVSKEPTVTDEKPLQFDETIKVDIRNRKEQFFSGEAKTVSSLNDTGEFDVLPQHANFVTLIKGYLIVDKKLPTEKKFEIENGVLAAKTGAVDVYLDF